MLDMMRRFASTLAGKILGALLLVGLAGFGISNVILDFGSNTLARVGSEDITVTQFQRTYNEQLQLYSQQYNTTLTNEQALSLGVPTQVLSTLSANAAINQFATKLGIGVSETRLAKMTREDTTFANDLGNFDRSIFSQTLTNSGYTEAEYFELQTRASRRQQIALGLFAGTEVTDAAKSLINRYQNDKRTIEYFTLNSLSLPTLPAPTDAELQTYLTEHQAEFRTAETRTIEAIYLTPEILSRQAEYQPTEEEIQAEYERQKPSLTRVERRQVQQLVLSDADADAEKIFTDAQAAGTGFSAALAASGLTATDFGVVAKSGLTDTALANAAFDLPAADSFTLIPGVGGQRVVAVTSIEPGGETSFDEARPAIVSSLALTKARNAYADIQDQIEEFRAAFRPLNEIADRYKLTLAAIPLTQSGAELSAIADLPDTNRSKVTDAVFKAEMGKLAATVNFGSNQNLWFNLTKVDPARDQTLDEVREAVTTAWTDQQTTDALQAQIDAITSELDSGKTFEQVATERNQIATVSQAFGRNGDGTGAISADVAGSVFTQGPDSHGAVLDANGEWLIYHVVSVTPAEGELDATIADNILNSTRDGYYADFIAGLTDQAGININQAALRTVLGLDDVTATAQ